MSAPLHSITVDQLAAARYGLTDHQILLLPIFSVWEIFASLDQQDYCGNFTPNPIFSVGLAPEIAQPLEKKFKRRIWELRRDAWWVGTMVLDWKFKRPDGCVGYYWTVGVAENWAWIPYQKVQFDPTKYLGGYQLAKVIAVPGYVFLIMEMAHASMEHWNHYPQFATSRFFYLFEPPNNKLNKANVALLMDIVAGRDAKNEFVDPASTASQGKLWVYTSAVDPTGTEAGTAKEVDRELIKSIAANDAKILASGVPVKKVLQPDTGLYALAAAYPYPVTDAEYAQAYNNAGASTADDAAFVKVLSTNLAQIVRGRAKQPAGDPTRITQAPSSAGGTTPVLSVPPEKLVTVPANDGTGDNKQVVVATPDTNSPASKNDSNLVWLLVLGILLTLSPKK